MRKLSEVVNNLIERYPRRIAIAKLYRMREFLTDIDDETGKIVTPMIKRIDDEIERLESEMLH